MKINFKKLAVLAFFSSFMLLVGCQVEEGLPIQTEEQNTNKSFGITESYISLKDLDQLPEAKAIISSIIEQNKIDPNGRSVYNPEYDFFIDTDRILRIDNGNYHSLTFPIYRLIDNKNIIENLVLSLKDDGKYLASIYKYEVTEQEKTALLNNEPTNIQGFVSRTILKNFNPDDINARVIQVWFTQIVVIPCSENRHTVKNFGAWPECIAAGKPQVLAITRSVLIDVGDDGISGGSEIGSGGGGEVGGNGSYTPPAFDPGRDFALLQGGLTKPLVNIKTQEQIFYYDFLGDNARRVMQNEAYRVPILRYLNEKSWNNESKAHAKQLLDYIYDGYGDESFINWAIELLQNYSEITPTEFGNWLNESKTVSGSNETFNVNNYPGKNKGMPFEWWNNTDYMLENIKIHSEIPTEPAGGPNLKEIFWFRLFPRQALLHIENAVTASSKASELVQNSTLTQIHNGKGDAFRHAY
ncbi:hypothetical protein [Flavobacterium cerinum]|uniref:Uncharacterized protein n=1 Tax=Flavobacterium cerinum TaxID=2502784 RepID=A0A3S3U187_9FLAO|nr:hypothetical protein [Flavobacterium cerinum]RWX01017.1 hypothetical protein EPI11_08325 [Flavobacterium cerinum]